jgi:hypothetical protein
VQVLRSRGRAGCLAVMLALVSLGARAVTPWPEVPDLPRTKYELVAPEMRVNGVQTHVEVFNSELSAREVIEFFRAHWAAAPAGAPKDVSANGWSALSTVHGPFQIAVQVKPKSSTGSEGRISIANIVEIQRDWIPSDVPRFADTQIVQLTETRDGPTHSRLVTMLSKQAFEINVDRWRGEWIRRGYSLVQQSIPSTDGSGSQWVGSLSKGSATVDMVIAREPSGRITHITVNLLDDAGAKR